MKRAKLRQVVSAVYHMGSARGAKLSDIEEYLRLNYGVLSAPKYKPTLKMAVREGFLKLKNNRFHPSTLSHSRAQRTRRSKRTSKKSKLLRMYLEYLMAKRRRRSRRRRRDDGIVTARRRRRSRRRRSRGNQGEENGRQEEKKENPGEGTQDKPQDPGKELAPSPLLEKTRRENEED